MMSRSDQITPRTAPGAAAFGPPTTCEQDRGVDGERSAAEELLRTFAALPQGHPDRPDLQERIVGHFAGFVAQHARRYGHRGEPQDDLRQAGMLGLVKAVQGFDPAMGRPFTAYATPMVVGEIKRHFRDRTWAVHVPRRLQEKRAELNRFTTEFTQRSGRAPTTGEIAESLRLDEEEAVEVMTASAAYSTASLDLPVRDGTDDDISLGDTMGTVDHSLDGVVDREALKAAMDRLEPRELRILLLRFFGNKTQSEIAGTMGISQMHVSRLITKALQRLRREMSRED